jgi:hypothetical protein
MKERIFQNARGSTTAPRSVIAEPLQYKIAVTRKKFVDLYPDVFELGDSEYEGAVDTLLDHVLVGNVAGSETATTTRNGAFLQVFDACCGYIVYRDQASPSSIAQKRPDDTVVHNGAVGLKNEAKADVAQVLTAQRELTDKLSVDAVRIFPAKSYSIFGMTTFPSHIYLYSIDFCAATGTYSTQHIRDYDMRVPMYRVHFIQAVFKIAEWMAAIKGPNVNFHLVPGVRVRTPNGHHVTWTKDCLLKELKVKPGTRSTAAAELSATVDRIAQIYDASLLNVEWGVVELPNLLRVTRIGFTLRTAVAEGKITRQAAIQGIRQGE